MSAFFILLSKVNSFNEVFCSVFNILLLLVLFEILLLFSFVEIYIININEKN